MMKFDEWWMPDGEEHLPDWMRKINDRVDGRLTYQMYKYRAAMKWVKQHRGAVDIGAHVGLWSFWMARDFQKLTAFEPMSEHVACWHANMEKYDNASLFHVALGDKAGVARVKTRTPGSSGDTGVDPAAERSSLRAAVEEDGEQVTMKRLDDYELQDIDFIKIDTEGYEVFIVRGAEQTLLRCKPCIIVEQKPETGLAERYGIGVTDAVKHLQSLGAVLRQGIQGDYILSFDD